MSERVVLDASALLALIWEEPGSDVVRAATPNAYLSAVNFVEVATKLIDKGTDDERLHATLHSFRSLVVPFSARQAECAGRLRRVTKASGLSLGDRACLALAIEVDLPVLTADRAWAALDLPVAVQLIR